MKIVEGLNSVLTDDVNLVAGIADLGVYVSMIEINIDVKNAKDQESVNMERINHTAKIALDHRSVNIKNRSIIAKSVKRSKYKDIYRCHYLKSVRHNFTLTFS